MVSLQPNTKTKYRFLCVRCGECLLNHAVAKGITYKAGRIMYVELLHQVGTVGLGSIYADAQQRSDFLGCLPFSNKLQNLALAVAQRPLWKRFFRQECLNNSAGNALGQIHLPAANRAKSVHQFTACSGFKDIPGYTRTQALQDHLVFSM